MVEDVGAATAAPTRATPAAWWLLAVLLLLYGLNSLDRGVITLLVDPIKRHVGTTDFGMSLLLGLAFAAFYALFSIPFGWAIDHWPRRLVLFCGVTAWSLATVACGLSNTYIQLACARFALGAAEAALGPTAHSLIADSFPKKWLSTALSIYTMGATLGTSIALALGGMVVTYLTDHRDTVMSGFEPWQATFLIIGAPGILLAWLVFTFREPGRTNGGHGQAGAGGLIATFRSKPRLYFSILAALVAIMIATSGPSIWAPTYLERSFGWSAQKAGVMLAMITLPSASIGTMGMGLLADYLLGRGVRDAHMRMMMVLMIIGTPFGIIGYTTSDPTLCLIGIFLFQIICYTYYGYGAAALQLVTPQRLRGRVAALYFVSLYLVGTGFGPAFIGAVNDHIYGDPQMLGASIVTIIVTFMVPGIVAAWLAMRPMRDLLGAEARIAEDAAAAA